MTKPKDPKDKNATPSPDATKAADSATKPKLEVQKKSTTITLPVNLNKVELIERQNGLLKLLDRKDSAAANAKASSDEHKSIKQSIEAEIDQSRFALRTNTEKRPVVCDQHFNHKEQTVTVFRCDTGARVHERKMTPSERQTTLDEKVAAAKKKEAKTHTPATTPTGK